MQKIFLRPEWRNYTLIFCHPLVHFRQSLVTVWWDMTSDFWDLWADIYQGRLTTTPEYASTIYIRVSYWSLENWIGALKHVKIWLSQKDTCLSCQICYVCYILHEVHVCQVCYWRYFQRYDIFSCTFFCDQIQWNQLHWEKNVVDVIVIVMSSLAPFGWMALGEGVKNYLADFFR